LIDGSIFGAVNVIHGGGDPRKNTFAKHSAWRLGFSGANIDGGVGDTSIQIRSKGEIA